MITLRAYEKADKFSLAENANSPRVAEYMRTIFPSPYTLSDAIWWIEEGHKIEGSYNLAIDVAGKCIGNIGFGILDQSDEDAVELGYWIGVTHWNKGIMNVAISLFVEQVFSHDNASTIVALVASPNVASMKVLEKCGFKCSEINSNKLDVRAGTFDAHVYVRYS